MSNYQINLVSGFRKGSSSIDQAVRASLMLLVALVMVCLATISASAQLAGKGSITGTVADPSGAFVPGATITATNPATGFSLTQISARAGEFTISPLDPGVYTVTVSAPGFQKLSQQDVHVNALEVYSYSPRLTVGGTDQTISVDTAPPQLETSNATLGATMENDMYSALPIEMGAYGQPDQRRATDFAFLMPGVQGNNTSGNATTNTGIVNGSGSRGAVSAVYIDGLPFVRAGGNGDPRFVWTAISVDAVDQFQVQTSGYSAIYEGQGIQNYTVKAGGKAYHGAVYEFFRNTALDTWGFFGTVPNPATGLPVKPVEHSNEYGINLSGPVIPIGRWREKLFAFGNYNGFRYASANPTPMTFPTSAQQAGNFQGVVVPTTTTNYFTNPAIGLFDPNSQAACTANSNTGPCRYRYGFGPGAGVGAAGNPVSLCVANPSSCVDIIPSNQFSAVALKMQSYLPAGISNINQNNYVSQNRTGLTNWSTTERVDYMITSKNTLTLVAAIGRQASSNPVGQNTAGRNVGPIPYNFGQTFAPKTAVGVIEDTYAINSHLVNQFKYGYARYNGPTFDADQLPKYAATTMGLSGLPAGPAQQAFPITTFSGVNAPTNWAGTSPGVTIAQNYTMLDNLQWVKGKHTITVGAQIAWLDYNVLSATGGSTPLTLANTVTTTAAITPSTNASPKYVATANTGNAYASFLVGQIGTGSFTQYAVPTVDTRFRAISPYIQDNWKVSQKLTLDLGVRYDMFPSLKEASDHQSFFSPTTLNPITGLNGALLFAGTGSNTCNCSTPVKNYYKNVGPRLGVAYQLDSKTVIRASYGVMFTHGNAVGGSASSLGTLGFSAAPSFATSGTLLSTFSLAGANGAIPSFAAPCATAAGPGYGTGYTLSTTVGCGGATYTGTPLGIGFPDTYLGSRAPEYINYTFGFQHQWSNTFTSTITYVGTQGHFLPADGSNARGYFADQLDPKYLSLGSNLNLAGTALTTYCAANAGLCPATPAGFNATQTLAQLLKPFPYQNVSDSFGYVANSHYNGLQVSLNMRAAHGLTFMVNYTWSRAIDDGGTFRTGYAIPLAFSNSGQAFSQDVIEKTVSTTNQPNHVVVTGVWELPIGKSILNSNRFERVILGGFKFSEIFQAFSGSPLAITASACQTNPAQITCEPTLNPNWSGPARQGGKWGAGVTTATYNQAINPASYFIAQSAGTTTAPTGPFIAPSTLVTNATFPNGSPFAPNYTFGNAPRTGVYGITGPGNYNLDLALVRNFPLHLTETSRLVFRAEMYNVTNHTKFNVASTQVGNSSFGQVTADPAATRKSAQFSARIEF